MPYLNREKAREYQRAWAKRNPEKVKAYAAGWRNRHPDKAEALRISRNYSRKARIAYTRYGITPEEKAVLFEKQGGCCAICLEPLVKVTIDHCHETGKVRGLLCYNCNVGLGLFKDSPERLHTAISYLER